jgi:hypothetical protein
MSRNPNRIKKGEGFDAKKGVGSDQYDEYHYQSGHFFKLIVDKGDTPPVARILFDICKLVERAALHQRVKLEPRNRWAKRRKANAYAWLDRNEGALTDSEFMRWYEEAKSRSIEM